MVDLNKIVDNYYNSNNVTFENILQLIEEVVNQKTLFEKMQLDPGEEKDITIHFPKIRITEDFGKIGTEDRTMIEKFTKNVVGNTLEEKLTALNNILTTKKEDATIAEILSTMVTCEILYAIVTNFTESAGGFIFEGFLAGLFGGQSIQIQSAADIPATSGEDESGVTGKPITDVILGDKHYSLKLLGEATEVKGSFRNMVEHFRKYDHVIYLDARRIGHNEGLQFGEFIITLGNFIEVFVDPFLKQVYRKEADHFEDATKFKQKVAELAANNLAIKKISFGTPGFFAAKSDSRSFKFAPGLEPDVIKEQTGLGNTQLSELVHQIINSPEDELQQYANFSIIYAESKFEGTKAEKLFGSYAIVEQLQRAIESGDKEDILKSLEMTPGYASGAGQSPQQFIFTRDQAENIKSYREIGTLMVGEEHMKATFAIYADLLKETISPVYEQLQFFTNNINDYFLGVSNEEVEQDRKQYALSAINNAQNLEKATHNAVEKIEK